MQNHRTEQQLDEFVKTMERYEPIVLRLALLAALVGTLIYLNA